MQALVASAFSFVFSFGKGGTSGFAAMTTDTILVFNAGSATLKGLPQLKIRVVNVVDLMKLQPPRRAYRRTNDDNIHVRGYKEEGTLTTPFDMTGMNELDRLHLVMDVIDRLSQTGNEGVYLKQQLKDKLIEHKQHIDKHGEDLP